MALSIILLILFASGYLSEEHMRDPQPFHCTPGKSNGGCPENMVFTNCMCEGTCEYPQSCVEDCAGILRCICPQDEGFLLKGGDCVPLSDCGCYLNESNMIIPDGESYLIDDCSYQWNCTEGNLSRGRYQCSDNATCTSKDGVFLCICNHEYFRNGQQCQLLNCRNLFQAGFIEDCPSCPDLNKTQHCYCNDTNAEERCQLPSDCQDMFNAGFNESGVYTIKPFQSRGPFNVYCDITNETGWTVFQRRLDGSVNFNQKKKMYDEGFGLLSHEFWLGNKHIKSLLRSKTYKLRIDLVSKQNSSRFAEYGKLHLKEGTFRLQELEEYNGNAGDALSCHKRKSFYVNDDGDGESNKESGGWWKNNKKHCDEGTSNLNGDYFGQDGTGITWGDIQNITYTEMKLSGSET